MTVFVDSIRRIFPRDKHARRYGQYWCHMFADTEAELHEMAEKVGLKRAYFQNDNVAHYDMTPPKRDQALRLGAVKMSTRVYLQKLIDMREERLQRKILDEIEESQREPEPDHPQTSIHAHRKEPYEKGEFGAILLDRPKR